jgi:hypothetical protein
MTGAKLGSQRLAEACALSLRAQGLVCCLDPLAPAYCDG